MEYIITSKGGRFLKYKGHLYVKDKDADLTSVGAFHPTIWKFIDALKSEHGLNETKIEQMRAGVLPTAQKKIYKDCNARIFRLVRDYRREQMDDFLTGIAYNFGF